MVFKSEEEIEWLKTEIIPELVKEGKIISIEDEKDLNDFEIINIEVKLVGKEVAFMLTSCYSAVVEYGFKNLKNHLHLFVKKTPKLSQEIFDAINFKALFTNEILAYERILPELDPYDITHMKFPVYFYSNLSDNSATLITEDFSSEGWQLAKKMVNISYEHVILGVENLGEFHGVGFAWRQLDKENFHQHTKDLKESRYESEVHPTWAIILRESKKRIIKATRQYQPSVDEAFLDKFSELLGNVYDYGKKRVKPREPLATLCHGDYLRNNMAFKYDPVDNQPIDVLMFDFQTLRVSSPMLDLAIFLSLSTYAEVRHKYFKEIFEHYVDTLSRIYHRLVPGFVPDFLSYDALLDEYIKFLPYSISICGAFLMTLVEPGEETSEEMLMAETDEEEVRKTTMTRGGEEVDRELAHQVKELYDLVVHHGHNIEDL